MDSLPLNRFFLALLSLLVPILAVAQNKLCTHCHDEMEAKPILSIYQTRHGVKADARTPTCQSCHGESLAHAGTVKEKGKAQMRLPPTDIPFPPYRASLDSAQAQAQSAPCLKCHEANTARHWPGSSHESRNLACTSCHTLHVARDRLLERATEAETCYRCHPNTRAQVRRPSSHPITTGKLACSSCHAVHGSDGPRLLKRDDVNDTCYDCHADKRGPFLWEHAPVTNNCLSCHTPHGSAHGALLKARSPWLCQQCHSSRLHPSTAYSGAQLPGTTTSPAVQIPLHGCSNCHSQVHGSNHPSGARLLR